MAREKLSDTYIQSKKRVPKEGRSETMDTEAPRLGLRVTNKGHRSFIYLGRFPGSSNPTRRLIGDYPTTTLEEARETAHAWDKLLAKGIDPKIEIEARRAAIAAAANADRMATEN